MDDLHAVELRGEHGTQGRDQPVVQLDGDHASGTRDEFTCQYTLARADLEDKIVRALSSAAATILSR